MEKFRVAAGAAMGLLVLAPVVAASPAHAGWWPEVPSSETVWNVVAILFSAAIAAGAAILAARWSAKITMVNARELQDRARRKDEESCAAILAADLNWKLTAILTCLGEPTERQMDLLANNVNPSTKVLDAVLPKLGDLGQDGAANLLNAYRGVEFVFNSLGHKRTFLTRRRYQLLRDLSGTAYDTDIRLLRWHTAGSMAGSRLLSNISTSALLLRSHCLIHFIHR